jgi:hypothetical protein
LTCLAESVHKTPAVLRLFWRPPRQLFRCPAVLRILLWRSHLSVAIHDQIVLQTTSRRIIYAASRLYEADSVTTNCARRCNTLRIQQTTRVRYFRRSPIFASKILFGLWIIIRFCGCQYLIQVCGLKVAVSAEELRPQVLSKPNILVCGSDEPGIRVHRGILSPGRSCESCPAGTAEQVAVVGKHRCPRAGSVA